MVRRQRAVRRTRRAAADAGPLCLPHALQPGHPAGGTRRPARRRRRHRERSARKIWRLFAEHYHLFRGTPSRMWLDWVFAEVFGLDVRLTPANRRPLLRRIDERAGDAGLPAARAVRALQHRGDRHHRDAARPARSSPAIRESGWEGRVVTAYRPDPVVDPGHPTASRDNSRASARSPARTSRPGTAISRAHRKRRAFFARHGRDLDRPRPSDARAPPTCARPMPRRCTTGARAARPRPAMPSCSAARC